EIAPYFVSRMATGCDGEIGKARQSFWHQSLLSFARRRGLGLHRNPLSQTFGVNRPHVVLAIEFAFESEYERDQDRDSRQNQRYNGGVVEAFGRLRNHLQND